MCIFHCMGESKGTTYRLYSMVCLFDLANKPAERYKVDQTKDCLINILRGNHGRLPI